MRCCTDGVRYVLRPARAQRLELLPCCTRLLPCAGPVMCAVFFTALKLMDGNPAGILPFLQASQA